MELDLVILYCASDMLAWIQEASGNNLAGCVNLLWDKYLHHAYAVVMNGTAVCDHKRESR